MSSDLFWKYIQLVKAIEYLQQTVVTYFWL